MKKKDNYTLLIIICIILLCIVGLLFLENETEEVLIEELPVYKLVDDYSTFFTLNSCAYKYITLINGKKTNDLLNVLDKDYIKNKNIDNNNVYSFIKKLIGNYSFVTKKIYYEENDKDKYYVYGFLQKESINGIVSKEDYYLIINLDKKNNLFSVTPYDGQIFKEVE